MGKPPISPSEADLSPSKVYSNGDLGTFESRYNQVVYATLL